MIIEKFNPDAPGRLLNIVDELGNQGTAFLPNPLPPSGLNLGTKSIRIALSKADRALARLDGIARQIERPDLLFQNYLRREALLSSKIEGTRTTLAQLVLFELAGASNADDTVQVNNYLEAFKYGHERLHDLRIGNRLLNEVHTILMRDENAERTTPGLMRNCTAVIGRNLHEARFVPPPFLHIAELMENLEAYLRDDDEPALLKLAIAHYQFETIHPYRDGNGRLGRLLISLFLQQEGILISPMLYISAYFERNQQSYYDLLLKVSQDNAWDEWILFFLEAVSTQAHDAIERTKRLVTLRAEFHTRVSGKRVSQAIHTLINGLFILPVMSVPRAEGLLGMTYAAAKPHVTRLVETGILDQRTVRVGRTNYYYSPALINALESSLTPLS
ncbi:MAG: Fic family protein [Vulcanimicrobiaceae bacterium]